MKLDEFNGREALVHISEISTTWVKNIRDHAREGQKLVLKVLRLNPQKGQIDLSLRRVTGREKTEKLLDWKKNKRAESILKFASEKLSMTPDKIEEIKSKILSKYTNVFDSLEESAEMGEKTFTKLDISPEWASVLAETAKQKIKIETAEVQATVEISSLKPDGIDQIKTALINAKKIKTPKDAKVDVYTIGAPKYRIEVVARNYSEAEKILQDAVNEALNSIRDLGGVGRQLD